MGLREGLSISGISKHSTLANMKLRITQVLQQVTTEVLVQVRRSFRRTYSPVSTQRNPQH